MFAFYELLLLLDDLLYYTYCYSKLKDRTFIFYIGNVEFLLEFLKKSILSTFPSIENDYLETEPLRRSLILPGFW